MNLGCSLTFFSLSFCSFHFTLATNGDTLHRHTVATTRWTLCCAPISRTVLTVLNSVCRGNSPFGIVELPMLAFNPSLSSKPISSRKKTLRSKGGRTGPSLRRALSLLTPTKICAAFQWTALCSLGNSLIAILFEQFRLDKALVRDEYMSCLRLVLYDSIPASSDTQNRQTSHRTGASRIALYISRERNVQTHRSSRLEVSAPTLVPLRALHPRKRPPLLQEQGQRHRCLLVRKHAPLRVMLEANRGKDVC